MAPTGAQGSGLLPATRVPLEPPPSARYFKRHLGLVQALSELWRSRELVRTLVERDLRVRYKQTILGFGWAVLGPVVFMLAFTIFFQRAAHFATGGVPYALFSYIALVPWNFFSEAVSLGGNSLLMNVTLMNKVYCPREVFPIAATAAAAFDTLMSTAVLVVIFVFYGRVPALAALWAPLLILVEVCFTLGVVFFASAVLVYLRDVRYVLPIAVQVGMFATPVAYGLTVIPKAVRPEYAVLDPLGPVLDGLRRTVLHGMNPDWQLLGLAAIASVTWIVGGYALFKKLETGFADIA